ncbi:Transcriptional regulatory protein WalR [Caprobacter fermentans]|uniref:Stage 0 sporulation protein A homolog n=1 Tax=Caproicibacter fermentans TaxID=2576756 RepID=A0A6N8HXS0_9FIRM|nr:response regulator transcription factor [Caproicibacter fermentans]MVB10320.1 Transcriptional regulatory protein WalR [Caproicibacter fermentans]OCN03219.1 DNA-binding response regulator [Clostridium sp. W14A]QNK40955.1 response regulator transcription factor [Caproicibacter fermentans]
MGKILIADDDREIAELISDSLSDEGYECLLAFDGESALTSIKNDSEIALIILDIMMPDVDGLEICRRIRETVSCPILFVTAKSRTFDAMLGFEMGADDYITKPFVVEELVARVKAHLRRERRSRQAKPALLEAGDVCLNVESYDVTVRGEPVNLSLREFQLLRFLCENAGKVLSREQIFQSVWGMDYGDIGTVAVNIKNLRDKIDRDGRRIKTVWGVGYKFVKNEGNGSEH